MIPINNIAVKRKTIGLMPPPSHYFPGFKAIGYSKLLLLFFFKRAAVKTNTDFINHDIGNTGTDSFANLCTPFRPQAIVQVECITRLNLLPLAFAANSLPLGAAF